MIPVIGVQELYFACFGFGFLTLAGSLVLTGGRSKAGRGGMRGGARGGLKGGARAQIKGGRVGRIAAAKAGGARGAAKAGGTRGAAKSAGPKGSSKGQSHAEAGLENEVYVTSTGSDRENENNYLEQVFFFLMGVINPTALSMCLLFFGASGVVFLRYLPAGVNSMIPAVIVALLLTSLMQNLLGWLAAKVENPALHILDDVVGTTAEVTAPIPIGKTGEVMFALGQGRKNYCAKAMNSQSEIKRGTKVLIIQFEDNVVYVQPLDDLYLDEDDFEHSDELSDDST